MSEAYSRNPQKSQCLFCIQASRNTRIDWRCSSLSAVPFTDQLLQTLTLWKWICKTDWTWPDTSRENKQMAAHSGKRLRIMGAIARRRALWSTAQSFSSRCQGLWEEWLNGLVDLVHYQGDQWLVLVVKRWATEKGQEKNSPPQDGVG